MEDIKKAFKKFQKNIKKEGIDLTGLCYMTKKQMEKRTATILICNNLSYEEEISREQKSIDWTVNQSDGSEDWKKHCVEYHTNRIQHYTEELNRYGSKMNYYNLKVEAIKASKAWKEFTSTYQISSGLDDHDLSMFLRIYY